MNDPKKTTSQKYRGNNAVESHHHSVCSEIVNELVFNGGNGQIVSGGTNSCIKVGHYSSVQALTDSFVSTGNHSMVIAGDYSDVFSGHSCHVITGSDCSVTTGLYSSVCAGPGTVITFTDLLSTYRFCVGESGLVPCVSYRLKDGQPVLAWAQ